MAEKETKVVERKTKKKKVCVSTPMLNIRKGPDFKEESLGYIPVGEYEVETVKSGFGKLADGSGWIFLACTEPVKEEAK